MKKTFALLFSCVALFSIARGEPNDKLSITMDNVRFVDVFRIFSHASGATFHYDVNDPVFQEQISINARDQSMATILRGILTPKGLLLLQNDLAPGTFSIVRAENEAVAARIQAAHQANIVIKAALEALAEGKTEKATELLTDFRKNNDILIASAEED